jgi:hypothetical protein
LGVILYIKGERYRNMAVEDDDEDLSVNYDDHGLVISRDRQNSSPWIPDLDLDSQKIPDRIQDLESRKNPGPGLIQV